MPPGSLEPFSAPATCCLSLNTVAYSSQGGAGSRVPIGLSSGKQAMDIAKRHVDSPCAVSVVKIAGLIEPHLGHSTLKGVASIRTLCL